jgi:hypothetical protein
MDEKIDGNTPAGERHAFTGKVLPSSDFSISPSSDSVKCNLEFVESRCRLGGGYFFRPAARPLEGVVPAAWVGALCCFLTVV